MNTLGITLLVVPPAIAVLIGVVVMLRDNWKIGALFALAVASMVVGGVLLAVAP